MAKKENKTMDYLALSMFKNSWKPYGVKLHRFISPSSLQPAENMKIETGNDICDLLKISDLRQLTDDIDPVTFVSFFEVSEIEIDNLTVHGNTNLFLKILAAKDWYEKIVNKIKGEDPDHEIITSITRDYYFNNETVRVEIGRWLWEISELQSPIAILAVRKVDEKINSKFVGFSGKNNLSQKLWDLGILQHYARPDITIDDCLDIGVLDFIEVDLGKKIPGTENNGCYSSFEYSFELDQEYLEKFYSGMRRRAFKYIKSLTENMTKEKRDKEIVCVSDDLEITEVQNAKNRISGYWIKNFKHPVFNTK